MVPKRTSSMRRICEGAVIGFSLVLAVWYFTEGNTSAALACVSMAISLIAICVACDAVREMRGYIEIIARIHKEQG